MAKYYPQAVVDEVNLVYNEVPEEEAVITTMRKVIAILVREGIARENVMTHPDEVMPHEPCWLSRLVFTIRSVYNRVRATIPAMCLSCGE